MAKMYYTEEEAAEKLGVSTDQLTEYVREKKLRLFKDGENNMYMAKEIDALSDELGGGEEEEVELAPAGEDEGDTISLEEADEHADKPAGKEDTVITAEGISIFDDEDLEVESADPMAKTQIAPSIEDQVSIEGVGSGSGLLDLTRESDDTSLGEVIDNIDLDEPAEEEEPAAPVGYEQPGAEPQTAVVAVEAREIMDASTGLFSGLVVGAALIALLLGALTLAVGAGVVPGYISMMKTNVLFVLIGALVLIAVFGVLGLLIGKSIAARQRTMQQEPAA